VTPDASAVKPAAADLSASRATSGGGEAGMAPARKGGARTLSASESGAGAVPASKGGASTSPATGVGAIRILGLDPGSLRLGYGILHGARGQWTRLDSGTIRLDRNLPLPARLSAAFDEVCRILQERQPTLVVLEECFVAQGPRAALVLGQVRGVLHLAVHRAAIPCLEFAPRAIKKAAVGNGNASKEQIQYMVPRLISNCPRNLEPDEADALAIAWCGASHAVSSHLFRPAR